MAQKTLLGSSRRLEASKMQNHLRQTIMSRNFSVETENISTKRGKERERVELDLNQHLGKFRVVHKEHFADFSMDLLLLRHEELGLEWFHFDSADLDNSFTLLFRTLPDDDTGKPHILEHTGNPLTLLNSSALGKRKVPRSRRLPTHDQAKPQFIYECLDGPGFHGVSLFDQKQARLPESIASVPGRMFPPHFGRARLPTRRLAMGARRGPNFERQWSRLQRNERRLRVPELLLLRADVQALVQGVRVQQLPRRHSREHSGFDVPGVQGVPRRELPPLELHPDQLWGYLARRVP